MLSCNFRQNFCYSPDGPAKLFFRFNIIRETICYWTILTDLFIKITSLFSTVLQKYALSNTFEQLNSFKFRWKLTEIWYDKKDLRSPTASRNSKNYHFRLCYGAEFRDCCSQLCSLMTQNACKNATRDRRQPRRRLQICCKFLQIRLPIVQLAGFYGCEIKVAFLACDWQD